LLDALQVPEAIIVGHDWGANVAWNAAMMRPDRFKAVFCLSVPYSPRGDVSVFDAMRAAGHGSDFYMFEQISPQADQIWSNAAVTRLLRGKYYFRRMSVTRELLRRIHAEKTQHQYEPCLPLPG
jgi:pimeloyl-ACP methyl ester carboxylesterase